MNFDAAVECMLIKGGRARRKLWDTGMWIEMIHAPFIILKPVQGKRVSWAASLEDTLALDWESV